MTTDSVRVKGIAERVFSAPLRGYRMLGKGLQRRLPKGLFPRSLLIIVLPVVALQGVVAYIFMERHWELVTTRLSRSVIGEIAALIEIMEALPTERREAVLKSTGQAMGLSVSLLPDENLPAPGPKPFFNFLDRTLSRGITEQIGRAFWIDTVGRSSFIEIRIKLDNTVLRVVTRRNQAYASNSHIFIVWMAVSALVIVFVAVLFLRNQIRPIERLAQAADAFGKGRPIGEFSLRGAREVRVASAAFLDMRRRIERQIEQRTTMLAGVSHDLRTVLTRFRLEVELLNDDVSEKTSLRADLDAMEAMLNAYLEFAKGATDEAITQTNLRDLLVDIARAQRVEPAISVVCPEAIEVSIRQTAFRRCLDNLLVNALRYGETIELSAAAGTNVVTIAIDDDGPGIAPEDRDVVFKPFHRLDTARNADSGGTGLGLSIALDIARSHGGNIRLLNSHLGGLRAEVLLPL